MKLEDVTRSDDSTDSNNQNDSDSTSDVHLFMASRKDPDHRDVTANHNPKAYELLQSGGTLHKAWTEKEGRSNVWSRSDVASHVLAAYEPLAEFDIPAERFGVIAQATVNALVTSFEGDTANALNLYDPDAADLVDYAMQSDETSVQELLEEVRDRASDDE